MEYYSDADNTKSPQANSNSLCNVLLVSVPHGKRVREPLGLAYIAGALKQNGIAVDILCSTTNLLIEEKHLQNISPKFDVVGFSATTFSFPKALRMAKVIKKNNPSVCVVLGGYHGTFAHENIMKDHPEFDVVVRGEGEISFVQYLKQRFHFGNLEVAIPGITHRFDDKIIIGSQRPLLKDLDSLAPPALDLLPERENYSTFYDHIKQRHVTKLSLISSRGCYGECTFCSITKFYGNRMIRCHSAERVINEVESAVLQFGVGCIHFSDDHFLSNNSRAHKILKGIAEKGIKIAIKISSRADQVIRSQEYLPLLYNYGLQQIEIGIENFAQSALDRFGKNLLVEDNIKAINILRGMKIRVIVDFILFDPWCKFEELEENLNVFQTLPPDVNLRKILFSTLRLLPGTELFDKAVVENLIKSDCSYLPTFVFKDPDVGEVHSFLHGCKNEGERILDKKKVHSITRFESLGMDQYQQNGRNSQYAQNGLMKNFTLIQTNKLNLNLFKKVLSLKKASRGKKMPMIDLQQIKDNYLIGLDSINM